MLKELVITDIPKGELADLLRKIGDRTWSNDGVELWEESLVDFIFYDFKIESYVWGDKVEPDTRLVYKTYGQVMAA